MKAVRALGEEFAMQGDRALAAKYAKLHRKQPPGQHGKKKAFAKITGYNLQLREKQKAKLFYQITEKDLRRYYANATKVHGSTNVVLLTGLERRLDNVVYRAGLANSHRAARQFVSHGHFQLNGKKANVPSMQVKAGDVITYKGRSAKLQDIASETAIGNQPVSWLSVDPKTLQIEVKTLPVREEIEVPFNEKLIIEFYSR